MKNIFLTILIVLLAASVNLSQEKNAIEKILEANKEKLHPVTEKPDKYEL